ncbi:MAG: ATP-dependent DNA helicase RecG [Candidatus Woesebacteria bacterium]|nr:MAG: ATP-dependent DNA helicase RecG [Candidatus Woesebacteria bacterium]
MDLSQRITTVEGIGEVFEKKLKNLEISKVSDLLYHIPFRYEDLTQKVKIRGLKVGETATFVAQVLSIQNIFTKSGKKIQLAVVSDGESEINLIWFNQLYLIKNLPIGTSISVSGKLSFWNRKRAIFAPIYEKIVPNFENLHTGRLVPVYPETAGVTSKRLRQIIKKLLKQIDPNDLKDFIPEMDLKDLNFPSLFDSIQKIHFPKNKDEAVTSRRRLAFNELLSLHLESENKKKAWQKKKSSHVLKTNQNDLNKFIRNLDFDLTPSQARSIKEISSDLKNKIPMNRLLEGDVGSGKTIIAAIAAFLTHKNNLQSVLMAPTQILAHQHFQTFSKIFEGKNLKISLITSANVEENAKDSDIFIGTHALIYKKVDFKNVGLVVIDEQHRFGVAQRLKLLEKSEKGKYSPHILTMTATPIPRTVALTLYGDLDLSTLDEMPKGRIKVTTWVVPPKKRAAGYKWINDQIEKEKIQAFVVCPLIELSEKDTMKEVKAATVEFANLKKIFKTRRLALLHGRLKSEEKTKILDNFKNGSIDILVSTPVVEVGIDVPNATIMVIEGAERFGLSQLHQLRGRVGRGSKKSFCLLMTESKSPKVKTRLNALTREISGRKLAEIDLNLRGPGEIFGLKQSGFRELKIANWADIDLIKSSKSYAQKIVTSPKKYKTLLSKLIIASN